MLILQSNFYYKFPISYFQQNMFFLLSKLLNFIIEPLVWVFVLLLLGIFYKNKARRRSFVIAAVIVFYFFTNNFIADRFMQVWEVPAMPDNELRGEYDAGIVLGGILSYDQSIKRPQFNRSADRLFQALRLYREDKIRKIVLDGGSGSLVNAKMREAPVMKKYLEEIGIPDSAMAIEPRSRNTHENAVFVKPILDSLAPHGRYLLITSASHMRRALKCFKKAGITVTPYSADRYSGPAKLVFDYLFIPDKYALNCWDVMLHEWVGYIVYKMMGYI